MAYRRWVRHALERILIRFGYELKAIDVPLDDATSGIVRRVAPFTQTDAVTVVCLVDAVRHVSRFGIPGDLVECGVWRGGSMMAAALTLTEQRDTGRDLYLFDTFTKMVPPSEFDARIHEADSRSLTYREKLAAEAEGWPTATLTEVRRNMMSTGYQRDRVHLVEGRVEETVPESAPESIALLRLDTDWYESTRHELEHLFDRISPGGILIIDDYDYWLGARRAIDEFLEERGKQLYLHRMGTGGRIAVIP